MKRILTAILIVATATAYADEVGYTPVDRHVLDIDSAQTDQLRLNVGSTAYFRDNEFSSAMTRGYTLPGFRLMPTVQYQPSDNVKLEAGVYAARFWGTDRYPNVAYTDIPYWTGEEHTAKGMHIVPVLRAQINPLPNLAVVAGTIYGGLNHNLLEPLYAPELSLTADPEAGAQILYSDQRVDADVWVNWESFIYRGDTHQEAFTFGVSAKVKYSPSTSHIQLYSPLQVLFQHRGGEIDTLLDNSVQTLMNAAAGLGARIFLHHPLIKAVGVEADVLVYNQQVGDILPHDHGLAWYVHANLDAGSVQARIGYLDGNKFISLFGYPFFGTLPVTDHASATRDVGVLHGGLRYRKEFSPGCTLGVEADIYRHMRSTQHRPPHTVNDPTMSYAAALYISINPSFLLKSFKK